MGLDEALLESAAGGSGPILRFYGWNPPAVSVGYFQGLAEEVDLDACKRFGFDVVRRISGGGAVLHKSELTYSVILPLDHPLVGDDLRDSYRVLSGGIIAGLRSLGIDAHFAGINDIAASVPGGEVPRKVSGNAQTRRLGCLLQHGTVLLDNDVEVMFEVLRVPREKTRGTLIEEVKDRVTSLRSLLGREVPFEEAAAVFSSGFAGALHLEYDGTEVSPREEKRARELGKEKFSAGEWLFKR
jgi:lipoate-protein ligase A